MQHLNFKQRFTQLEQGFISKSENEGSKYLPNIPPIKPANFIFIATEPSFGIWAHNKREAKDLLDQGFKHFMLSEEDFILHYCINEYLCTNNETYYITDLSKGAMLGKDAKKGRMKRYQEWYPLLNRELEIVSRVDTKYIAIGKTVYEFLKQQGWKHVIKIPHYSSQNSEYNNQYVTSKESDFNRFCSNISLKNILQIADDIILKSGVLAPLKEKIRSRVGRLKLSQSQMRLIFVYKTEFSHIPN